MAPFRVAGESQTLEIRELNTDKSHEVAARLRRRLADDHGATHPAAACGVTSMTTSSCLPDAERMVAVAAGDTTEETLAPDQRERTGSPLPGLDDDVTFVLVAQPTGAQLPPPRARNAPAARARQVPPTVTRGYDERSRLARSPRVIGDLLRSPPRLGLLRATAGVPRAAMSRRLPRHLRSAASS